MAKRDHFDGSKDLDYRVGEIVDSSEVPNWARRLPKWADLLDQIRTLKPKQSLTVIFPNHRAANRARNTVRDTINDEVGSAVMRTRIIDLDNGESKVYFTRLAPEDVVEEERD